VHRCHIINREHYQLVCVCVCDTIKTHLLINQHTGSAQHHRCTMLMTHNAQTAVRLSAGGSGLRSASTTSAHDVSCCVYLFICKSFYGYSVAVQVYQRRVASPTVLVAHRMAIVLVWHTWNH
jgi:hypothetical protein